MPKIGQAMAEGTVLQWHRRDGDRVTTGEILVTIETDKATYDLEAPASGTLHIYINEGQAVAVGTVIGEIGESQRRTITAAPVASPAGGPAAMKTPTPRKVLASPKAKRLAAERGIDLSTITPSSADGIISVSDVENALAAGKPGLQSETAAGASRVVRERRQLTGIRKTSARRLYEAWRTIPHIVQMVDVDASALLATRARLQAEIPSLTLNDIILQAAAHVMAEHADLNGTVQEETLVLYEDVAIGFAVDTPRGLVVPVMRRADTLSLAAIAAESQRLIEAARSGRLGPNDIGGASLTVSNLGMFGIRAGTPVINLGESVLVFVGAIEDRPVVVAGQIVIRPTLTLSIAYDHRVADGVAAARFTRSLKEALERQGSEVRDQKSELDNARDGHRSSSVPTSDPRSLTPSSRREVWTLSQGNDFTVQVRSLGHAWVLDEPVSDGGTDAGPDPVSAFLGALLACLTIAFQAAARRRKVTIERIEGRVHATPEGHVKSLGVALAVWSPDPEETVRGLLERAKRSCYVSSLLKSDLDYTIELSVHPTQTRT